MIFNHSSSQSEVFKFIQPLVNSAIEGFNCSILAYGQTGSGKTYTMFGKNKNKILCETETTLSLNEEQGIIQRGIEYVYDSISQNNDNSDNTKFTIYLSFIQIYNEKIYDCLQDPNKVKPLKVREDKFNGVFIEGLTEYHASSFSACKALISRGEKNRVTRQTKANINSSRSHSIIQLMIETAQEESKGVLK